MPDAIGIRQAKANFSALVEAARNGRSLTITHRGRPVARLVPALPVDERRPGALKGKTWVADDFDDTPEEVVVAFEGRRPRRSR